MIHITFRHTHQPGFARGSGDHLLGVEMSLRGSGRSWKENRCLNPSKAYANLVRMAYTRVKAYGAKWYRWYPRQHRKIDAKVVHPGNIEIKN
jgi:hypothetical protein